jgi:hypothetical protein
VRQRRGQITQIDADTEQKTSSSAFICVNLRANAFLPEFWIKPLFVV